MENTVKQPNGYMAKQEASLKNTVTVDTVGQSCVGQIRWPDRKNNIFLKILPKGSAYMKQYIYTLKQVG